MSYYAPLGPQLESPESIEGLRRDASGPEVARLRLDRVEIADPARAAAVVDSLARLGVRFVKARSFASAVVFWAIAGAARRNGIGLAGHPPFGLDVDPVGFADSGQRTMEHWYFPTDLPQQPQAAYDRVVAGYRRAGTALVPTLGAWRQHRFVHDSLVAILGAAERSGRMSQELLEHWRVEVRERATEGAASR